MNWNKWLRQVHRWLSIAFTLAVIGNVWAMRDGQPALWLGLLALIPLALLLLTGLYLFVLPYSARWRSGPAAGRPIWNETHLGGQGNAQQTELAPSRAVPEPGQL